MAIRNGRWRKCEARCALHYSADEVVRCKAEWQQWLERQEERDHGDEVKADFLILDGGNPTSVRFKLVNCSRTLKENRDEGPFNKSIYPF